MFEISNIKTNSVNNDGSNIISTVHIKHLAYFHVDIANKRMERIYNCVVYGTFPKENTSSCLFSLMR